MNIKKITESVSLKEKIAQMFIFGFRGTELDNENTIIQKAAKLGIGGIILFADNIKSYYQTSKLTQELQNISKIALFVSIDQEGGLVERTINIDEKINYLTPMALSATENVDYIKMHSKIMAQELKSLNINMNFAPVLDVNTNINNPIIGIRAISDNTDNVIKFSEPVYSILKQNNIIPVGKHFPGHGEA